MLQYIYHRAFHSYQYIPNNGPKSALKAPCSLYKTYYNIIHLQYKHQFIFVNTFVA